MTTMQFSTRVMAAATPKHVGKEVFLAGWVVVRRDHGKLIFFDLRDRSGKVQLVVTPDDKELHAKAETLRPEWVVGVIGLVVQRPEKMKNPDSPTGGVEVQVKAITVYAESETPPFDISGDGRDIGEEHRMEYRYLDLRRPRMLANMELRDKAVKFIRDFMSARGFLEIETP